MLLTNQTLYCKESVTQRFASLTSCHIQDGVAVASGEHVFAANLSMMLTPVAPFSIHLLAMLLNRKLQCHPRL